MSGLAQAAEGYAARGWPVLPLWWSASGPKRCACRDPECGSADPEKPGELLGSPAKHPLGDLVPNGKDQATTDPIVIRRWWAAQPRANVGIRTGAVSGLLVLDVDGKAGAESVRSLVRRHGRFRALWVETGTGWHAYLAHRGGSEIKNSAGRLGPGLDVRADDGYVVAPPSLHAGGRRYRWRRDLPSALPLAPAWLLELLRPPASQPGQIFTAYVLAAVEAEARAVAAAPEGQRNHRLNRAAYALGQLVGAGLISAASVSEILLIAAQTAGLGEREAEATIRSGLGAGQEQPRPGLAS